MFEGTVYLVSGQNPVQLYAFDPSGVALRPLIVNASGSNILRVDAGSIQVSANVSGNVVYLTSGQNPVFPFGLVDASGQLVGLRVTQSGQGISGEGYRLIVAISGDPVSVSGQVVRISGQTAAIGGIQDSATANLTFVSNTDAQNPTINSVPNAAYNYGYDLITDRWKRLRITASGQGISGVTNKLIVALSGDPVSVSGNAVAMSGQTVSLFGETVAVSGQVTTSVSGNMVSVSGQPVDISGEIIQPRIPVQIRTRDTLLITGASGGVALLSGDVLRVTVRNIGISGTVMYVGGSGDYPWVASGQSYPMFSGRGFWLRDGDGVTVQTENMANVRVVSHTSGQYVSYIGEQF
jgi:hypothetical protein